MSMVLALSLSILARVLSGLDLVAVVDVEVGAAGQVVGADLVAVLVGDDHARLLGVSSAVNSVIFFSMLPVSSLISSLRVEPGMMSSKRT